jgi:phosphoribosyl-ATP pyrophosphohydrolase
MGLFGGLKNVATMVVGKEKADALEKVAQEKLNEGVDIAKKKIGEDKVNAFLEAKNKAYDELCARTNNMTYDEWMEAKKGFLDVNDPEWMDKLIVKVAELDNNAIQEHIEAQESFIKKLPDGQAKNDMIRGLRSFKCTKGICPDCNKNAITESDKTLLNSYEKEATNGTSHSRGTTRYASIIRTEDWNGNFKCNECDFNETLEYKVVHPGTPGGQIG